MQGSPFRYVDKRIEGFFWARVAKTDDCWLWIGNVDKDGYGILTANIYPLKSYTFKAHRLAWFITNADPYGYCVLHRCDNPSCVNPGHLFLGTFKDNTQDMLVKGRYRVPSNTILSYDIAESIREKYFVARKMGKPITQMLLAAMYGVKYNTIWKILHNKTWVRRAYLEAR